MQNDFYEFVDKGWIKKAEQEIGIVYSSEDEKHDFRRKYKLFAQNKIDVMDMTAHELVWMNYIMDWEMKWMRCKLTNAIIGSKMENMISVIRQRTKEIL